MTGRSIHAQLRHSRTAPRSGQHAYAFGARIGYWPCLRAPFVVLDIAKWRAEVWYGDPPREGSTALWSR